MALLDAITFGIASEAAGFTATESCSLTTRSDKVEATDEDGEFASFSFYNTNGEFSASGYGSTDASLGGEITALGGLTAGGSVFCSELLKARLKRSAVAHLWGSDRTMHAVGAIQKAFFRFRHLWT